MALRWHDVDFAESALTIARAMSAGMESSTKSGHLRRVPLADQAAAVSDRMSRREHFTTPGAWCSAMCLAVHSMTRRCGGATAAQTGAGVQPLRFHDLRHTFGSLLAMRGVDVVTIQSRYLHARPASEHAQAFTAAFMPFVQDGATTDAIAY